jgi:hypothetical protein
MPMFHTNSIPFRALCPFVFCPHSSVRETAECTHTHHMVESEPSTYPPRAQVSVGCIPVIPGCLDTHASNFAPDANRNLQQVTAQYTREGTSLTEILTELEYLERFDELASLNTQVSCHCGVACTALARVLGVL